MQESDNVGGAAAIYLRAELDGKPYDIEIYESNIYQYIEQICQENELKNVDIVRLVKMVYPKLKDINSEQDIDEQIVSSATDLAANHYDYEKITVYLLMRDLHKKTETKFLKVAKKLLHNKDKNDKHKPIVSQSYYDFVERNHKTIDNVLNYDRDYNFTLFGFKTLEKIYLKKDCSGEIIERPQHLFMRVAIAIHYRSGAGKKKTLNKIFETYELMSQQYFVHATPTLFNAGSNYEQLSSCFLLGIEDDMAKVGKCWKDCAVISKYSGGIGIHVTRLRVSGAYVNSTQGKASGMKFASVFNDISRCANQGGRPGSFALYIEPWHGDIEYFINLKKNTGAETERARDLFLGLVINDIFMKRVEEDGIWSLMCPSECPDLLDKFGEEFTEIYEKYEKEGKFIFQMKARTLWFKILEAQIETGVPYMLFKDATNKKSNQSNIGVINGSNLCIEIVEVSTSDEYAVCNLASICLPKFVEGSTVNYKKIYEIARIITYNLNNIIDINFYPSKKTKKSNMRHRPIGIGVQGLANVFMMLGIPFDSEEARDINKKIFESIYYGFLTESMELAKVRGPYETFKSSPLSEGKFQFNLWGKKDSDLSTLWDWPQLRKDIMTYGVLNSLGVACMPTASTSQIMGCSESVEACTSNIFGRSTLAGDYFYVVNKYLIDDLTKIGLWNDDVVDLIKYYEGSVQHIDFIPERIKKIYRTVWEIEQNHILEMAADRGICVDQTQSMNIYMAKNNFYSEDHYSNKFMNSRLTSSHFYAWKLGLKTGMYYFRSKPASEPDKFGIDIERIQFLLDKYNLKSVNNNNNMIHISKTENIIPQNPEYVCSMETGCLMCGS